MAATASQGLSLLEKLASSPETSRHVKEKANVFASYVWSYNFRDLMAHEIFPRVYVPNQPPRTPRER